MKKQLLIIAVFAIVKINAQPLPNGTFENWTSLAYNEPDLWNTGNNRDLPSTGIASVTRVTGVSGYGLRIQTNATGPDTSDSYIINTNNPCSDPDQWTGGVPYSQKPTAITGQYRYSLLGNDTALIVVIFRKNGVHIGDNFILIRGNGNQSTFTSFSFSLTCSGVPDSVIIAATSNGKDGTANNGSFIEFDNLAFAGTSQPIPNGDFENWTSKSYDVVSGWKSWGSGFSKTGSSYAGTYAVRLETMNEMCGGYNSSGITTGYLTNNYGPDGGRPYTKMADTLCGYYKYTSVGGDTANIYINLSKNGNNVGGAWKQLKAAANYVYFEIPIYASINPDTMRVDIQSSKWPTLQKNVGSVLYLDNLYLKSQPSGIFEEHISTMKIHSFPNPARDVLFIKSEKNFSAQSLSVYDAIGKIILKQNISGSHTLLELNVSTLSKGIYYCEIKTRSGDRIINKFIKD